MCALALAACSADDEAVEGPVTVYVSLPLTGPAAPDGRDAADGAKLALEQADGRAGDLEVEAKYLNGADPVHRWDPAAVGRNARRAAQDSSTAAYIGELDSQPTRTSLPITNDAGIAQISPGASAIDLTAPAEGYPDSPDVYRPSGEATFARVVPSDAVTARALAAWAGELGLSPVAVRAEPGPFAALMASEFTADAEELGVEVLKPGQEAARIGADFGAGAGGIGPGVLRSGEGARTVASALVARELPERTFVGEFRESFGRSPGPYAAYGYEAMRVALDAIEGADTQEGFRGSVVDGVLGSDHPSSALGSFSIDGEGDTSLCTVQRYRLEGRARPDGAVCPDG
jgi:branched-chain amino acid transport system substrate-binding protein